MVDYVEAHSSQRLGFMVPLVLFVLFFVACCGVVASVFLRAASETAFAEQYNAGVQLCRNQAEICRGETELTEEGLYTLYFDRNYRPTEQEQADYYLTVSRSISPSAGGNMRNDTITAYTPEGKQIYMLDVAVYLPEGR